MKSNTIGFNNFKSFGDKIQTFSQKPITLIYGPNSIGKSSLLHFLLYMEYLKESGEVNLTKSDFAGDQINLGGFTNFIHKKNTDKEISYQIILNKSSDIEKIFSPLYSEIARFEKDGAFKKEITETDIINRLNKYCKIDEDTIIIHQYIKSQYNSDSVFPTKSVDHLKKSLFETYQYMDDHIQEMNRIKLLENELEIAGSKQEIKEIFKEFKINSEKKGIPEQEQKNMFEVLMDPNKNILLEEKIKNTDNEAFDIIDKLILFILDTKEIYVKNSARFDATNDFSDKDINIEGVAKTIYMFINQFYHLINIKNIKLDFKLGKTKLDKNYQFNCSIDGNLIFTYDSVTNKIQPSYGNNFLLEVNDVNSPSENNKIYKEAYNRIFNNLYTPAFLDFGVKFPWEDYYGVHGFIRSVYDSIMKTLKQKELLKSSQYLGPLRFYPERDDLFQKVKDINVTNQMNKFVLNKSNMSLFIKYPFLKKIFFIFNKEFIKAILNSLTLQDALNKFRKNKNKISSGSAMNSEKMWSEFINSPDIQNKINLWLSDDTKLKTPYTTEVIKGENTSFFRKLFKLPPLETNQLVFVDKRTNTHVTPREMGLGISQLLPVLVATNMLEDHKIFVEQPELHLHPAVQCEIADEIIKSKNLNNNELIIETHSEHLLLRMMKRLRHTDEGLIKEDDELALTPDDICLLYVDNNGEFTYLNELELDDDGTLLDPWPNGFFEEGYNERFS